MDEKKAKGAVVNGYLKLIKRKWGIQGVEEAMEYAGIKTRPKDGEWLSMVRTDKVLEWIAKNKGMEYVREAGKYTAKNMGIFQYLFASIIGMERFLKRAEETYGTIFNFGEIRIKIDGKTATANLKGARFSQYSCTAWEGALLGFMEVTKSHGTVKALKPDSPEDCKFFMEWD